MPTAVRAGRPSTQQGVCRGVRCSGGNKPRQVRAWNRRAHATDPASPVQTARRPSCRCTHLSVLVHTHHQGSTRSTTRNGQTSFASRGRSPDGWTSPKTSPKTHFSSRTSSGIVLSPAGRRRRGCARRSSTGACRGGEGSTRSQLAAAARSAPLQRARHRRAGWRRVVRRPKAAPASTTADRARLPRSSHTVASSVVPRDREATARTHLRRALVNLSDIFWGAARCAFTASNSCSAKQGSPCARFTSASRYSRTSDPEPREHTYRPRVE